MIKKYLILLLITTVLLGAFPTITGSQDTTGIIYWVNVRVAKVRIEPKSTAKIVATVLRGKSVTVIQVIVGEKVGKVDTWYKVKIGIKEGYILSSLLTDTKPAATTSTNTSHPNDTTTNMTPIPTDTPVIIIAPHASQTVSCGGARTCGQMASCEQAKACLAAGNRKLDSDHDGVPCESICLGG